MTEIISLKDVDVTFHQTKQKVVHAVQKVSLSIEKGDIFAIVGFSGAGKSTLVRTINLLQVPTNGQVSVSGKCLSRSGRVLIGKKELQQERRQIGMIFQGFNLLNETTVIENIAFALRHTKLRDDEIEQRCLELLRLVGLQDKAEAYPSQLSGGQQQRVAIARALANKPNILISDEATSALDPQNTEQILKLLKRLNRELGLTIVLITHEMSAVKQIANKVAVMQAGQLIEQGDLHQIFLHPKKELTRQFVGGSSAAVSTLETLHLAQLTSNEAIFQLVYNVKNVTQSIIVELYRKLGIEASMLYGNVELLNDEPVGTLVILVKGDYVQQTEAVKFLKAQNVDVSRLDERGNLYD